MANQNFTDFTLKVPASGDFLVGYNANGTNEFKTTVAALISSYATNTLLQSTSALLTPTTTTRTLTGQLVLNTDFNNYRTSVASSTATLLPTTTYRAASGNWQGTYEFVEENYDDFTHTIESYGNWDSVYTHVKNVSSTWGSPEFEFSWTAAPAASGDPGTAGQVAYAANYFYVCVAPSTWKRTILAAW